MQHLQKHGGGGTSSKPNAVLCPLSCRFSQVIYLGSPYPPQRFCGARAEIPSSSRPLQLSTFDCQLLPFCRSTFHGPLATKHSPRTTIFRPISIFIFLISAFPIFRTFFQVPYPASPLLATLTKTPGVWGYSSHSGTRSSQFPPTPFSIFTFPFSALPSHQSCSPRVCTNVLP